VLYITHNEKPKAKIPAKIGKNTIKPIPASLYREKSYALLQGPSPGHQKTTLFSLLAVPS
jgi:hypothetical protein